MNWNQAIIGRIFFPDQTQDFASIKLKIFPPKLSLFAYLTFRENRGRIGSHLSTLVSLEKHTCSDFNFLLQGLKVVGAMCMVRNSVGSNCYVADEIITSRNGIRLRVGNTDAEVIVTTPITTSYYSITSCISCRA